MCTVCSESESENDDGCYYTDVIVGGEDTIKQFVMPKEVPYVLPLSPPSHLSCHAFLHIHSFSSHIHYLTPSPHTHTHTHTHYRLVQWWYIFVVKMLDK